VIKGKKSWVSGRNRGDRRHLEYCKTNKRGFAIDSVLQHNFVELATSSLWGARPVVHDQWDKVA